MPPPMPSHPAPARTASRSRSALRSAPATRFGAVALLLVSAACGEDAPATAADPVTVVDSAGIRIVTNDLSRAPTVCTVAAEPRLVIGEREGDPTHELYRVFGGSLLSDGRLALVDQGSQQLRIYGPDGTLLSTGGRAGEGPGEFTNAFTLTRLAGDTLWVGDYRPWGFEIFDGNAGWVRGVLMDPRVPNSPEAMAILPGGSTVLASTDLAERDPNFGMRHLSVVLYGPDGMLVDTLARLEHGRYGQTVEDPNSVWLFPWFESFAEMIGFDGGLATAHGREPEVRFERLVDGRLEVERILRWTRIEPEVTNALVDAAIADLESRYAELDAAMRRDLLEPLVHEGRPVAEHLPAMTSLFEGRDGSLWVSRYPLPGGDGTRDWLRFDAEGRFACTLTTPAGLQVWEFGEDWIVGEREGALGVETVVVFDLTSARPAP